MLNVRRSIIPYFRIFSVFLVFLKSLVFSVVSTVLRVRCYLHLRWYYSNLMFNAFRTIFISILVFGSLVFWHWKVFIQIFLGFLYKSVHALEIIKAVNSVHHAIACKYKIPSEHLRIFVGEHHLASLCGFTLSPFHIHS